MSSTGNGNARRSGAASKARAVLAALSLLVLGAVLGIAIDRHFLSHDYANAAAAFHDMTMSSLEERLDLSAEQRRQIDSIVASHHDALRNTWQILHSRLGAVVDTVHNQIEAILTPGQRVRFREWLHEVSADH